MEIASVLTKYLMIGMLALGASSVAMAADLTVNIPAVSQDKGYLMVALYKGEESFNKEQLTGIREKATNGEMVFTFNNLVAGDYAIMVFHDINGNGELDSNLLGLPKEPWGASLQGKKIFGAPEWKDVRFDMTDSNLSVEVELN